MKEENLESKVVRNSILNNLKKIITVGFNYPFNSVATITFLGGIGGWLFSNFNTFNFGDYIVYYQNQNMNDLKLVLPGMFLGYIASTTLKKLNKRDIITIPYLKNKLKAKDIITYPSQLVIENPTTTALTTSAIITQSFFPDIPFSEKAATFSTLSFFTESYLKLLRTKNRIKRSKIKPANNSILKYTDKVLEYPGLVAATASITSVIYKLYYNNTQEFLSRYPITIKQHLSFQLENNLLAPGLIGIGCGVLAGTSTILLASFLHSRSIENTKNSIKANTARILGKKDLELIIRESMNLDDGPTKTKNLVRMGNIHLKNKNKEKAMEYYRDAIKSLFREPYYDNYELLRSVFTTDVFARIKNITSTENNLETAIVLMLNGDIESSEKLLIEERDNNRGNTEETAKLNYLLLLSSRYSKNSELFNKSIMDIYTNIMNNNPLKIGKSKATIVTPSGNFLGRELVLKFGDYNQLIKECRLTKEIIEYISESKDPRFLSPYPIAVMELKPTEENPINGVYFMDYELGETLKQRLLTNPEGSKKNLDDIADFLAFIHANIDTDLIEQSRDHKKEIMSRLNSINIDKILLEKIKIAIDPFVESLKDSEIIYDKDAHSDNWLVTDDNKIVVLDCENRIKNQRERDIANLTDTWNLFTEEGKEYILRRSNESYQKYKGIKINYMKSKITYHHAVIIKALEDIPQLYQRKDLERMDAIIQNAYSSINALKRDHKSEIKSNYLKIQLMETSLRQLEFYLKNNPV